MVKSFKDKLHLFLLLTITLFGSFCYAQTLDKPELNFTSACGSASFNNFSLIFDFSGGVFATDNVFRIQLSDASGDFTNGQIVGAPITGQNFKFFDVPGSFSVPDGIYGTGYRVRILSSNPQMEGPPSDPFEAYKITSQQLVLNNFIDKEVLCNGATKTLTLNEISPDFTYRWFRNGTLIPSETSLSLTVSQPGRYLAQINYGQCSNVVNSTIVDVTAITPGNLTIQGDNEVQICATDTYQLIASVNDPSFVYKWYKDGQLINLPPNSSTYTTGTSNQFGVYYVEIEVGGCTSRSQDVTIRQRNSAGFDVTIEDPTTRLIFPGETIELSVSNTASGNVSIKWFKDNVEQTSTQPSINVIAPGVYYAEVTETGGGCAVSKKSPEYTILGVNSVEVTIRESTGFRPCNSENTQLTMSGIIATATDGNNYPLSQAKIDKLSQPDSGGAILLRYQWFKDNTAINGATTASFDVNSYTENAEYYLEIRIGGVLSDESNRVNLLLGPGDVEITSSSPSNSLCPGGEITFTLPNLSGYTYTWFKDGAAITVANPLNVVINSVGTYSVRLSGFGCQIDVPQIEVVAFDASVLMVSPATNAVLPPGGTVTLQASGADSYEWFDASGSSLSTNETLVVSSIGTYRVVGTVGGCTAEREVNVVEDDGMLIIPNIITPFNGDGVNDKWELPNRFAFQTNVQVIIFNSRGEEILNTTDYQNNWPLDNNIKDGMLFYFKVIRENTLIKAGTISVLQ